jgi:predicted nucleic acid-binding protein
MVTNPRAKSADCQACKEWLQSMLTQGVVVAIPEIIDYEVRRELIRANRLASIRQLDQLLDLALYLPITTEAMRRSARLWAVARQTGQPTAHPQALDGDVILAAQTIEAFGNDPGVNCGDEQCFPPVAVCRIGALAGYWISMVGTELGRSGCVSSLPCRSFSGPNHRGNAAIPTSD